jgi:hypothetical protein
VNPLYCMRCDVGEAQARCTCNDVPIPKPHFRLHTWFGYNYQWWFVVGPGFFTGSYTTAAAATASAQRIYYGLTRQP